MHRNSILHVFWLLICIFILNIPLHSINRNADSLLHIINSTHTNSVKALAYAELCLHYNEINPKIAVSYGLQAYKIAKKMGNKRKAISYANHITFPYYMQGNYDKAYSLANQFIQYAVTINDTFLLKTQYNTAANVLTSMGKFSKANFYYQKAIHLTDTMKDADEYASLLNNLAINYEYSGKIDSAFIIYDKALNINKLINRTENIAMLHLNIGELYLDIDSLGKAEKHFTDALPYLENSENNSLHSLVYACLAILNNKINNYQKANEYYKLAIKVSEENYITVQLIDIYKSYAEFNEKYGHKERALFYLKKYVHLNDSIYSIEIENAVNAVELKMLENQKRQDEKIHKAELAKQASEIKAKRIQQYALYVGLGMVLLFSGFMYNRVKIIRKQKKEIEEQKNMVENKQTELLDSIRYAKRIQDCLLPNEKYLYAKLRKMKQKNSL